MNEESGSTEMKKHSKKSKKSSHKHVAHQTQHVDQNNSVSTILITVVITIIAILIIAGVGYTIYNASTNTDVKVPPTTGGKDKIQILEYGDFECPFCARAQPTIKQVKETYGDKVEFVFKHFPLSFHPNAQKAAEASECAKDQGKFDAYHDLLFANQDKLAISDLKGYAVTLGLNTATFNSCLDGNSKAAIVAKDMADGQAAGVSGTPAFIIDGEKLVGAQPFSEFKRVIDSKLSAAGTPTTPATPDPKFGVTIITDASCKACDVAPVVSAIQTQLFPTATIKQVEKKDAAALIAQYKIEALPAYIFDKEVTQTANYDKVAQAFMQVGDKYVIAAGAAGPVKLLKAIDVTGKVTQGTGKVVVIEFSDFQCPFCKKYYDETYKQLVENYVKTGKITYVHMNFPLDFHAQAKPAAEAAYCAREQSDEAFWKYHDIIFANQGALDTASLSKYAKDLSLDVAKFDACVALTKYDSVIDAEIALGKSVGVSGTPSFYINGVQYVGALPYEAFAAAIDAELAN